MPTVFISYRHQDSDAFADMIYDEFERRVGNTSVFLDVKGLEPGERFAEELRTRIQRSSVVLVLIGPRWLAAIDKHGVRRLERDNDWVRTEVREALLLGKRVIPVLVRGAQMPTAEELPPDMRALADLHGFVFTSHWLDLPRLGGMVDGRLSIAEPIVIMALASSYAFSERAAQQLKAKPYRAGDTDLAGIAGLATNFYHGVGTSLYYGVLVFGALFALRTRVGWRMEEMLRIALCSSAGAATGFVVSLALYRLPVDQALITPYRLALWFLGLSAGAIYGLRRFAPISPPPATTTVPICAIVSIAAFTGTALQSITSDLLRDLASAQLAFLRGAFWGPVCLFGAMAWWLAAGPQRTTTAKQFYSVVVPVLLAMLAADLVALLTSYIPYASSKDDLLKAIQDKQAQDTAVFFAVSAGVAAWRVNRVLQEQASANGSRVPG